MGKLTLEKAKQEIEDIKKCSGDDEIAHTLEDGLYRWFVSCLATGMYNKEESIEIAKIVNSSLYIEFQRWCA